MAHGSPAQPPDDDAHARHRFDPDDDDSTVLASDVSHDREGYWVELTVGFRNEVVRRRIGPYLTRRIAEVAAEHIRRAAGREAPPPTGH